MNRIAVIVIGSNSTRLLAADACADLSNAVRERVETRLFLGMSPDRTLTEEAMDNTVQAVWELQQKAQRESAQLLGVYATSASRDAANADVLCQRMLQRTGLPLTIISGEEEAAFSFLGASGGRRCGVIDIGGGSTEVVLGEGRQIFHAHSLQLGASRLFKACPINSPEDIPNALQHAGQMIGTLPADILRHDGFEEFFLMGGTCTSMASLAGKEAEGFTVTLQEARDHLTSIAAVPREKRAEIPGFPPTRVDILPAGLVILVSVMEKLRIERAAVTKRVNADGLLRAYVHKKFA